MLVKRSVTAAVLILVVLGLLFRAPAWAFFLVVLPFGWLALWEYLELAGHTLAAPARWPVYILAAMMWATAAWFPGHLLAVLVLSAVVLFILSPWRQPGTAEILPTGEVAVFALVVIAAPVALLIDLRGQASGEWLVCYLFLLVWAGDAAAYFVGRAVGRHKITSRLSPGKTVEGTVASLVVTVAGGCWLGLAWFELAAGHAVALPLVVNVAAQLGDLGESALKRSAGVKDSSALLPGHGGVLDRIDGLLVATPALWYYWNLLTQGFF